MFRNTVTPNNPAPEPETPPPAHKVTSDEIASLAGQTLRDPNATPREKRLAASVLSQYEVPPPIIIER
jgi:hypothetical protein